MERLTTNKDVSEMNMVELAHNSCYAKDKKARYRDFETDIDARELARMLIKKHLGEDAPENDDVFDDYILECLVYGVFSTEGLIALFYRNLWAMAEMREKLKHYEDLEESGRLVKLPCTVGDTVYVLCECGMIPKQLDGTLYELNGEPGTATGYYCPYEDDCPHVNFSDDCEKCKDRTAVFEDTVQSIWIDECGVNIVSNNCTVNSQLGEFIFLTREAAEAKLKEMEERE